MLEALDPADFSADVIEARCRAAGEELGWKAGDFFRPLRVAVTGRGRHAAPLRLDGAARARRTLARIDGALGKLQPVAGGR